MQNACVVILAAGDGTRMKSAHPKVLCEVLFKPMIGWVADCVEQAGVQGCCAVLGDQAEAVRSVLPPHFEVVQQHSRRGTGHAASMAAQFIGQGGFRHVAVLNGDAPFVRPADLCEALAQHQQQKRAVTVFSAQVSDPFGYGRIVRREGELAAIVEQADADAQTQAITEINAGAYWFDADFLLEFFQNLQSHNNQGEYYLTDCIDYAVRQGRPAGVYLADSDTALGANDRKGLALLNAIAQQRKLDELMQNGVDIPFGQVVVGQDVSVGSDTVLLPGTIIRGQSVVGSGCEIGPNSYLDNAVLGDGCRVISSHIDCSTLEDGVKVGPMSNVRPGCVLRRGAKIGDFVELKNAVIGETTAVAHLSYIGDSDVGQRCNVGCGVVTVNYDGSQKHRTVIGDDVFVGCNSNLVAPVRLGDRSYCAAATTVTADVPDDALVIGRVRQEVKAGWAKKRGKYRRK